MGGKALLGALLLASLCLAQPRQLKQSLSDVRGPVRDAASWALDPQLPAPAWIPAWLGPWHCLCTAAWSSWLPVPILLSRSRPGGGKCWCMGPDKLSGPDGRVRSAMQLETLVNAYVPPDARPALYSAASAVINSVPGAAAVVNNAGRGGGGGSSSGGSSGSSGTQNGGQGVFCTTCGPSGPAPAGSAKAPASGNTPAASSGSGSGGSRPTFDTSSAAQG